MSNRGQARPCTRCSATIRTPRRSRKASSVRRSDRFRFRRGQGREQPVQADRARGEIRRRRASDRDLSAGQVLRQALCAAAGRAGQPRPASHHRLQRRTRTPEPIGPRRQTDRASRLHGDHRDLGPRHSGQRLWAGPRTRSSGSPSRIRTSPNIATPDSSGARRPARTSSRCCWTAKSMPRWWATSCRIRA